MWETRICIAMSARGAKFSAKQVGVCMTYIHSRVMQVKRNINYGDNLKLKLMVKSSH